MRGLLASLLTPRRVEVDELLDQPDAPADDVERSLRDLRRMNRFLGGRLAWRRLVRRLGGMRPGESILEIGSGTSDLLETIDESVTRIGLDIKIDHLLYGRRAGDPSILRVVADASRLPFRNSTIHLIGSSHFFHHFSLRENVLIFDECLRVARRGIFATDTRRSVFPWLFVRLLGLLGIVGSITRFDAPASVLQSYTIAEIRDFAGALDHRRSEVSRMIPFRYALVVRKEDSADG